MDLVLAVAGLVILIVAGDVLVRGAVAASLHLGVPPLLVSLTIVAFGTSAPELLIAIKAALEDAPGLALGNVIGSNIANVFLVLGVPALISRLYTSDLDTRDSFYQMVAVTLVFMALLYLGPLSVWHGALLLVLLVAVLVRMARSARKSRGLPEDLDPARAAAMSNARAAAYIVAGIVALPIGADILVDAARALAIDMGVSEEVIGLTLVAVGTSLPELATTVMAAIRRQADVALGNVIGSNLLNILAIMGIASLFGPLAVPDSMLRLDIWVMLAAALALAPFAISGVKLGRRVGVGFLVAYGAYIVVLF
ncbi:calcium/sodium antiporter [Rhodobacteraceae bacterium 2CG4]|uniref:Calcium/sodium antiporter n=1 Tax=Halovulum marinum TaxID=2662447 RepID=A0A6L5Z5P4_9RHOB|nr:calcium/sodium antiporter [Halovulum marinum]MSU91322.1 calcium/sodium antiporter [Halovulum marinum]